MRRRVSAEQWREWLEEFGRSEVTVKEFCRQKGVCQNSFYQWRKKLGHDLPVDNDVPTSAFLPVAVSGVGFAEIELPGGAIVRVPNDAASLQPVLKVLFDLGPDRP